MWELVEIEPVWLVWILTIGTRMGKGELAQAWFEVVELLSFVAKGLHTLAQIALL